MARVHSPGRLGAFSWARVVNPLPLIIYTILGGVKVLVRLSLPTGPWRARRLVVWLRLSLLVNLNSDQYRLSGSRHGPYRAWGLS